MKRHLVWLRADLRLADNPALHAACADADVPVACVYTMTPGQWREHDVAGCRVEFELRSVARLQADLEALNIPLRVIEADEYQQLPAILEKLVVDLGVTDLFFNQQYEVNEQDRDTRVSEQLMARGISVHRFHDQCAVTPGKLLTGDGRFYSVFSPFKRQWLLHAVANSERTLPPPGARTSRFCQSDSVPLQWRGFESHLPDAVQGKLWPAGEAAARLRLQRFVEGNLVRYKEIRDFPALRGTSTLSPWLAVGAISVRQCVQAALIVRRVQPQAEANIDCWISELCWRDFYRHILVGFPRVSRNQPFLTATRALPWNSDPVLFKAWCEGRTGYPLVDAAMRQLKATGWMHNRLRMVTAMFLTKDLFIDWRLGERFFMQHLIDGDLASNNGGWQWSASTGNDAAPYFRVFNPVLQSERFDPDGIFIRHYVPELAHLDNKQIHAPWRSRQPSLLASYPAPIVDHAVAKAYAVEQFRKLA